MQLHQDTNHVNAFKRREKRRLNRRGFQQNATHELIQRIFLEQMHQGIYETTFSRGRACFCPSSCANSLLEKEKWKLVDVNTDEDEVEMISEVKGEVEDELECNTDTMSRSDAVGTEETTQKSLSPMDESCCAVCLESESYDDDPIVFCDEQSDDLDSTKKKRKKFNPDMRAIYARSLFESQSTTYLQRRTGRQFSALPSNGIVRSCLEAMDDDTFSIRCDESQTADDPLLVTPSTSIATGNETDEAEALPIFSLLGAKISFEPAQLGPRASEEQEEGNGANTEDDELSTPSFNILGATSITFNNLLSLPKSQTNVIVDHTLSPSLLTRQ
ncbi:hypothetical protein PsorP6_013457 [Peronosclerospora sorghi]|uniref:Uncharacterized protein n=1 Tax=Peronosclerospora sorghi TaxID=230839 RepID=A0ACC0VIS8_9STRA|nr:hypothetical protein PsorP6_013457 [Peronosclerospora sorghi]